jgi:hypothetical protein
MKIVKQFEDVVKFEVEILSQNTVAVVAVVTRHAYDQSVEKTRIEVARIDIPTYANDRKFKVEANTLAEVL